MIRLLWLSLTKSWQEQFPTRTVYVAEILTSILDVLFYYFTSESIGKLLFGASQTKSYFEYVVWNEALISIPVICLVVFTKSVRSSHFDSTWEILLTAPRKLSSILLLLSQADIYRSAFRSILILVFAALLGAKFSSTQVFTGIFLLIISLPLFLALGIFASGLYIRFERGFGAITHGAQLLSVFAGTYFPISVFPVWLQKMSVNISPWTWLIQGSENANLVYAVYFIIATVVIVPVSIATFNSAIQKQKQSGRRLLSW